MDTRLCERCATAVGVRYAVSPFPHVGGLWLCPPCREAWLAVQERPSLDRMEPLIEPSLRVTLLPRAVARMLPARPRYRVERSPS